MTIRGASERLRDERGMNLVELMVTMFVLGVFTTVVVGFFAAVSTNFTRDREASASTDIAAVGMDEMTRVIRSGTELEVKGTSNLPMLIDGRNESMKLYTFLDTSSVKPAPLMVQFTVAANRELVETRWKATAVDSRYWNFPASTVSTKRTIARLIKPRAAGEDYLFTYYDVNNVKMVMPSTGYLTDSQRLNVKSIKIEMIVQADLTQRAKPVTLRNKVGIPNLGSRVGN